MTNASPIIICVKCQQANRIAAGKDSRHAKCGKCGMALFGLDPVDVSAPNFRKQVAKSDVPVLIDVWAPWCGPCKQMGPQFAKASQKLEPHVRLIKLNSEREQALSQSLDIRSIPTMLLMYRGRELARISGAMSADQIENWVKSLLSGTAA